MNLKELLDHETAAAHNNDAIRNWDRLWRQRKTQRLFHPVQEAAKQLKTELARRKLGTVILGSENVEIRLGDSRILNISLSLHFDSKGNLNQNYQILDREIRRLPDYEELDSKHSFATSMEALHYVVRVCAKHLDRYVRPWA